MFTESRANAHLLHYSSHYLAGLSKVCPVRAMTTFYNNNIYTDHPHNIAHCIVWGNVFLNPKLSQRLDIIYITRMRVSHRGKSYPVNQIVIITVFASSSSDCFNSLIISNDQSSSRPMNEILAWQHLFVTTIILYVCYGLRKYSNNTTCCSSESRKTLIISQHGRSVLHLFPCDLSLTVWSPATW